MVVPWVGFALGDLLKRFAPTSRAKYVAFETLHDPQQMPGQRRGVLDWPYVEGLTMAEAMHPLTMLASGCTAGAAEPERRAAAPGGAVEVWLQEHQEHRAHRIHRAGAAGHLDAGSLGSTAFTPTSIHRWIIRAEARRGTAKSAPDCSRKGARRRCSTATLSKWRPVHWAGPAQELLQSCA